MEAVEDEVGGEGHPSNLEMTMQMGAGAGQDTAGHCTDSDGPQLQLWGQASLE